MFITILIDFYHATLFYVQYIFFILTLPSFYLLYLRSVSTLKDNTHFTVGSILHFAKFSHSYEVPTLRAQLLDQWSEHGDFRRREMDFHGSWR